VVPAIEQFLRSALPAHLCAGVSSATGRICRGQRADNSKSFRHRELFSTPDYH
jgi:hypothetical protein